MINPHNKSFDWYAYVPHFYYGGHLETFLSDEPFIGFCKVVGYGHIHKTFYNDLGKIAKTINVKGKPVYVHVVFVFPVDETFEHIKNGAHTVNIYRMKKVKGVYYVAKRDGDIWNDIWKGE